eukprot:scaffold9103_cov124-Isochrysis_galbana.AAC.4
MARKCTRTLYIAPLLRNAAMRMRGDRRHAIMWPDPWPDLGRAPATTLAPLTPNLARTNTSKQRSQIASNKPAQPASAAPVKARPCWLEVGQRGGEGGAQLLERVWSIGAARPAIL